MPDDATMTVSFQDLNGAESATCRMTTADLDAAACAELRRLVRESGVTTADTAASSPAFLLIREQVVRRLPRIVIEIEQAGRTDRLRIASAAVEAEKPGVQALVAYLRRHARRVLA